MAIDYIDGFDHINTEAQLARKGWLRPSAVGFTVGSNGRRGGGALAPTSGASTRRIERTITASNRYCVGFAMYLGPTPDNGYFCYFNDSGTAQCGLFLSNTGAVVFARGTTGLATSTEVVPYESWFHIELLVEIHNSTGSYEVRLNGTNILSDSGVDTQESGTAQATKFCLSGIGTGTFNALEQDWRADDLVIQSGAGADFLGDCRIDTLLPTSDGNSAQFTPSTGADNYALVDDSAPDDDSTYVESSTVNHVDTYGFPSLSHTPASIYAVQVSPTVRLVDSGARSHAAVLRSGTTDYVGSTEVLSTSYLIYPEMWEDDPDTAAAWTASGVNALEAGQKVIA